MFAPLLDAARLLTALRKSENYNGMGLVDPDGKFHSTDGMSHPDWAHENRHLVGWEGTKNSDYEPATGDDAVMDNNECIALDAFKDNGWIRIKPNQGIELSGIGDHNVKTVHGILRQMARTNPGRSLYVDDGGSSKHVPVDMRGRPDLRAVVAGR